MGLQEMRKARTRSQQTPAVPSAKPHAPNFGFGEELSADIAMEKLLGHNFIDDGKLLESDAQDPGSKVRSQLALMDGLAFEIRKGLNALVREGVGMVEEAQSVDLGEGTETLAAMKPVLGRLMTAYTELVAGLQKARESVGYEVEGPSVTQLPEEAEMQERITRNFAQRRTQRYMRESVAGGAEIFKQLYARWKKDPEKLDVVAQDVSHAMDGLAGAMFDALYDTKLDDVKKALKKHIVAIPNELRKGPAMDIEKLVALVAQFAKDGNEDPIRAEAQRLRQLAHEIHAASLANMAQSTGKD